MESQPASARPVAPPAAGPSRRRKLAILAICSSSLFIVGVDVTAVNVALPSLERDLGAGVSGLQWTVNAYTVVMASRSGMLIGVEADVSLPRLLGAYAVFGAGFGLVNAPITNTAVSGMPRAQAGVASAIATTSRQVGQTLGVAIVGAIIASSAATTGPGAAALSRPAWLALTAAGVLVLLLGVLATSNRAVASARITAKRLNPEALAA
jgi:hypothetical protein